jgi:lipopolysaccharide heptosyltransferase II
MTHNTRATQHTTEIRTIHTTTPPNVVEDDGYPSRPDTQRTLRNIAVHISKFILLKTITFCMSTIGGVLWLGRRGKNYPRLTPHSFHPQHILVIRLDLIGDLVMSLPVIRTLKRTYPDAEIDLLAVPSSAAIVAVDPDLAQIIPYDPNIWRRPKALIQTKNWRTAFALRRRLKARHYDLAISVFGNWAAILAALSGAPRRVGFGQESYLGFMTDNVAGRHWDPHDHQHEVDYCLALAQVAGATITEDDRVPQLTVLSQAQQEVEQLCQQEGITADKPLLACHVSSNNGQSKRWPVPYWATLLDRLIREEEANIVLIGAPNDLPLIEKITRRMHTQPINLAGKTSLTQLAALLQRADILITGDSGPMHIAAAVGTSVIAIHGPTDPVLTGPVSPKATVLRSDIWCSPCYNAKGAADCRFYTTQCMKNITPTEVWNVVHEKLQKRSQVVVSQENQE